MNERPVHEAHKTGFLLAISEALLLQEKPEAVAKIVSLLVAPGVTYEEINNLPERAITRTLDKVTASAGIEVPETRVEYLLNLLPLLTPNLRFCGSCRSLDLRPKAGKWQKIESGSCCRCGNGIYESVVFDQGPTSWVNGRTYDPGTEVDENRNPLTDQALISLMVTRGTPVDREILLALGEPATHMPLVKLCAHINQSTQNPSETLKKLESYHNLAVDPVALRLYLRRVLLDVGQTTAVDERQERKSVSVQFVRGSKPVEPRIFNKFFYEALGSIYSTIDEILPLLREYGMHTEVALSGASKYIWFDAVTKFESRGRLSEFVEAMYRQHPIQLGPIYEGYFDVNELHRSFNNMPVQERRKAALVGGMREESLTGPYPMDPYSWFGYIRQNGSLVNLYTHLKSKGLVP